MTAAEIIRLRRRVVIGGVIGIGVFQVGALVLPTGSFAHHLWVDLGWVIGDGIAAWWCFAARRAATLRTLRVAWTCIAIAVTLWTAGAAAWAWNELVRGQLAPFPSMTDYLSWFGGALFLAGVFFYRAERVSVAMSLRQLADLVLMLATLVGLTIEVLYPQVAATPRPAFEIVAALVAPMLAVIAVSYGSLCLWQRPLGKRRRVLVLLLSGSGSLAIVAVLYIAAMISADYAIGHWTDGLWLVSFLLVGWGALEERWLAGDATPAEVPDARFATHVPVIATAAWMMTIVLFGGAASEALLPARVTLVAVILVAIVLRVWANERVALELRDQITREEARRWRLEAQLIRAHKLETLGTLAGGVAHDFNNVLTATGAALYSARRRVTRGDDPSTELGEAERVLRRAAGLTDRLLGLAHQRGSRRRTVDVAEMIGQIARLIVQVLPPGVHLHQDVAAELPRISVDPTGLEHALLNLGINARDALRERGGTITLRARTGDDGGVIVEVADDGPGIAPEVLPQVFEAFFTTKPEGEGSGLGLAMVHAFVSDNGGEIDVASTPGEGACFRLRFARAVEI